MEPQLLRSFSHVKNVIGVSSKMLVKWTWVLLLVVVVVLNYVKAYQDIELNGIIKDINDCAPSEVEFCMGKWIFKTLKEVSDRPKVSMFEGVVELRKSKNDTDNIDTLDEEKFTGRSSQEKQQRIESMIVNLIYNFLRTHTIDLKIPDGGRAQGIFRTYRRFRRFFMPLLIGVKLKLAAFLPFVLSILGVLGSGAFLSGNAALFLSGLTIFLRYFYPKTDHQHSNSYHHKHDTTAEHEGPSSTGGDYSHGPYHHYHHPHHHHHH